MSSIITKTTTTGKSIEVWMRDDQVVVSVDGTHYADTIVALKTPIAKSGLDIVAVGKNTKIGFTPDEYRAIVAATTGTTARFAGVCAKSGRRYGKGARIEHTQFGWALVGAGLDITYNMGREDSSL